MEIRLNGKTINMKYDFGKAIIIGVLIFCGGSIIVMNMVLTA